MTHDELCDRAVKWLYGRGRCLLAFKDRGSAGSGVEIADAIGWRWPQHSVLIECKTSRADFLADRKKQHRQIPAAGMGQYRYFMALAGLLKPEEMPEHWGLLAVYPAQVRVVREAEDRAAHGLRYNQNGEWRLILATMFRLNERGCVDAYVNDGGRHARR